MMKLDAHKLQQ